MAQAFDRLCGGYGQWVIGILGLCSGLATVNVYTASVARLTWSFSQQGVLPAWFQPLNRHQVPERALYLIHRSDGRCDPWVFAISATAGSVDRLGQRCVCGDLSGVYVGCTEVVAKPLSCDGHRQCLVVSGFDADPGDVCCGMPWQLCC